ncbi:hypothetical protein [uncultured Dokdonia sp.]|uniref:hypothetical protein n=1 Tax=uncultured Dokdonia sp. TaxID=575653 RepID=UPI0026081F31|nr:hypothetical protein [uncultured Dokdonia sp.]
MRLFKFLPFLLLGVTACNNDDDAASMPESDVNTSLAQIAIIGDNLVTGSSGNVVTWNYLTEESTTINLQEEIGFEFGFLRNTIGDRIAIASGIPTSQFITYGVVNGDQEVYSDYFTPSNPVNEFELYTTNTENKIITYYVDGSSTCCNLYISTYNKTTAVITEAYIGNVSVSNAASSIMAKGDKTFIVGTDTLTGVKKLFVHNADIGDAVGVWDIDQYGAYIYDENLDVMYLFDFNGTSLSHATLDFETLAISEQTSFPEGFTVTDGFNQTKALVQELAFKDVTGKITNTYNYNTNSISNYTEVGLINTILDQTGMSINIRNTDIAQFTSYYIVMGTIEVDGETQGVVVILNRDLTVIQTASTGDIRPNSLVEIPIIFN